MTAMMCPCGHPVAGHSSYGCPYSPCPCTESPAYARQRALASREPGPADRRPGLHLNSRGSRRHPRPEDDGREALLGALERVGLRPCSDGNCILVPPRGMHTNGGCRCLKDTNPSALRGIARKLAAALREVYLGEDPPMPPFRPSTRALCGDGCSYPTGHSGLCSDDDGE